MHRVPFLDVGASYRELRSEIDESVKRVLEGGWYIGGEELEAFEQEFATYVGAHHAVGTGTGLDALQIALQAMNVGSGDEVIVPSNTFIATWLAVSNVGAVPIPVEPLESTFNLDPDRVQEAITSKTKAIVPVHLYGQPADLDPILEIAHRFGIRVLEDAAQAHGARYRDRRIGAHGDAVAWSFYPGKNLGAFGDGGAVTTNDQVLADRIRVLGNYGSRTKYVHETLGVNSRLDPLQAAVLRVKLRWLDEWNSRRSAIAETYRTRLQGLPLVVPGVPDSLDPVWHLFVVRTQERDRVREFLAGRLVDAAVHYPIAPHLQRAYRGLGYGVGAFPVSEAIHREVLSLPIGPHMRLSGVDTVVEALVSYFG